ncbi:MAG: hypothetical protein JEZ07_12430 [Phycisphaerae bacterium]|nr:hypothetical protein [Phycisphaerae bacterium]
MSKKSLKSNPKTAKSKAGINSKKVWIWLVILIAISGLIIFIVFPNNFFIIDNSSNQSKSLSTVNQLLELSPEQLAKADIALVNLICAKGLSGSENLNIELCLKTLDDWAKKIEADTKARLPQYNHNPSSYDNSPSMFKCVNMILYLKDIIGVDYNIEIMESESFANSSHVFLHGCLSDKKQGGCISLPTLCVAVGRRLGYPLKLVQTREHCFFRWQDDKETFNMEICCPGCDTHEDEYYKNWPRKISDEVVKSNQYLKSLTPQEELALFLETRGHCLSDHDNKTQALVMFSHAYDLMPKAAGKLANIEYTLQGEIKKFGYASPNRRLKHPTNFLPKGLPDLRPPQVTPTRQRQNNIDIQ